MRRVLATAVVLAIGLVTAAPAGAAGRPTLRSLQAQITTLKTQVKALKKQTRQARDIAIASLAFGACSTAATADTFQSTWTGLDSYFTAHSLPAYFGAQTAVNDYDACRALQISRVQNQNPPTVSVLRALLDLFKPGSSVSFAEVGMDLASKSGDLLRQLFVLPR
ncbi:MAG TPA: hypothetical protein VE753_04915 [Gaiellaceae bacterium]|nr:hypothetical protein [Gaiellaceae bacterium]